ncbi:MAG: hypothetical protein DWP98_11340, partial [Bacteroidetes bacterium]
MSKINKSNLKFLNGLFWEDKEEAIEKKLKGASLELKEINSKSLGNEGPKHRIIESDNLAALQVLKTSGEKFQVIYIDPPYNTGNKDFKYNDHYVDAEDEIRHSNWISFMFKRLEIAKDLLSEDG